MKTAVKNIVNNGLEIIETISSTGKKCLSILTDKRLSKEDFVDFMNTVRLAEHEGKQGFGFTKYFPEHKAKLITVMNVDLAMLTSIANSYTWSVPEKNAAAKKSDKNTKATKQTKPAVETIDPAKVAEALALLQRYAGK